MLPFRMRKIMAQQLRSAIRRSRLSQLELSRRTGVAQQTINDFLHGSDIRLSRAQKLADYFGLELRPVKPPKAK